IKPSVAVKARQVEVVADRTTTRGADQRRLTEALEASMRRGAGRACIHPEQGEPLHFSNALHCARCNISYRRATPGLFTFNSPIGACEGCRGFGRVITLDLDVVLPDHSKTLAGGAIRAWTGKA